ncbi:MAG TPA: lysophospholipid acyltransferase family protein [Paracoccaceae bacterium]|nr:lysophospholipid acyltransferase family protein [Paracoccaceae bacterium]
MLRLAMMAVATVIMFPLYAAAQGIARLTGLPLHHPIQVSWARLALFACGLRFRQVGRRMPHGGALVANHASWLDIFALLAPGRVIFLAKSEVRHWPVIGLMAAVAGTMFIERKTTAAKRQQEEMRARIAHGQLLCFFPEGTSTDGLRVLPFKSTLFAALHSPELRDNVWVQPATILYEAPRGRPRNLYGWWGTMPFGRHVWDIVTSSFGGRVTVIFHPPVRAADFADRKALAKRCGDAVASGMAEARARARVH